MTQKTGHALIQDYLRTLDSSPGVYRMLDAQQAVLYVGKARDLRARVSNYARPSGHSGRIARMIRETASMMFLTTRTETEALLLEQNLIKQLKPRYNVLLRDDKSFPNILVAKSHAYPQIKKHRGAKSEKGDYYGPFASAGVVNRTLTQLQRVFLLRNCTDATFESRTRPCLLFQIKRCSAPCVGRISEQDYGALVADAERFLQGKTTVIQANLARDMAEAAENMEYERAAALRDRIKAGQPVTFDVVKTPADGISQVFLTFASALVSSPDPEPLSLIHARLAAWLSPETAEARLMVAQILQERQQFDLAEPEYDALRRMGQMRPAAELARIDTLSRAGRTDEAGKAALSLTAAYPDLAQAWIALGDLLRQQEKFAQAVPAYDKALALLEGAPDDARWFPLYARGIALERSRQFDRAEADFLAAIEIRPDQASLLNYLGYSWIDRNENLDQALELIDRHRGGCTRRITLGADKAYDVTDFVGELRSRSVTPHIAIDGHLSKTGKPRKTAIDRRTLRHAGYAVSQRCRKRIEEVFGWIKGAGLRKTRHRGTARVGWMFTLTAAAYNLIRLPKLLAAA